MSPYVLLIPEFTLLVGACVVLFADLLPGGKRTASYWGAAFAVVAALAVRTGEADLSGWFSLLAYDGPTHLARVAIAALTAVFLVWMGARGTGSGRDKEAAALALFSALGCMFLVAANDLITLYIALELSTMPAYVLIGYSRRDELGLEGALKYFLLSLLTSLVMVYGLSFVYGFSGSTSYGALDLSAAGTLGLFVAIFASVGFMAKLSAAPFHYWTPDAYEGATPHMVAFVSTVPKVAGLVALVHFVDALAVPAAERFALVLAIVAAASMLLGNLGAFPQDDMRRLMAYSGIAHTGYLLMGVVAGTEMGFDAAVYYAVAYTIPSLGAMFVFAEHGVKISDVGGLAQRRPWIAWTIVVLFLSLVGIPPTIGFFGKLYLFGAALDVGAVWLVLVAVAMSVASLGYYFRVVKEMFFGESPAEPIVPARSRSASFAIAACLVGTLGLGIIGSPLLSFMGLTFP